MRIRKLAESSYEKGIVVYQMCRDLRADDNDALIFAQELANSKQEKLIVNYVIWNYKWEGATRRFYDWVIPSLQEVEEALRKHNIPLVVTFQNEKPSNKNSKKGELLPNTGAVVIDQLPLRFMSTWKDNFLTNHLECSLYEVDSHNCIPVWELSPKQEFAARTIRSKAHAKLPRFLETYEKLQFHKSNEELLSTLLLVDWDEVRTKIICNEEVSGVGDFVPGYKEGMKVLSHFLHKKLATYDTDRNNFNIDGQSNLSPYISHGNISRRRVMLELIRVAGIDIEHAFDPIKNGSNGKLGGIAAFIEETVVRAELCENFCFYNKNYDTDKGFPEWAKVTLTKAKSDARTFLYTKEEFEKAKTHDPLWNAAQLQMVETGKMHGYMRMYWAKKILEWSQSPEVGMKIAVWLNDTYELDGRDPGGYVGCAWSIGGVHDRPWFGRPIFGTIRYMAVSGVMKRGKAEEYMAKWNKKK